jgi:formate dehydrogenase subunit delta
MKTERLVDMANQIADFFAAYPRDEAIAGVADHLKKFWDPRLRRALISRAQSGGAGLRDLVREAIPRVSGTVVRGVAVGSRAPAGSTSIA